MLDRTSPQTQLALDSLESPVYKSILLPAPVVSDNYDSEGDIRIERIGNYDVNRVGWYLIRYFAVDRSGNRSDTLDQWLEIYDREKPSARLLGNPVVTLCRWQEWDDPGISARDNYTDSTNLTIRVSPTFTTMSEGLFLINYTFEDGSGNSITLERTVYVKPCPPLDWEEIVGGRINYYPNPAGDYLQIEYDGRLEIKVFDLRGRLLISTDKAVSGSVQLDISKLPIGSYLLELRSLQEEKIQRSVLIKR